MYLRFRYLLVAGTVAALLGASTAVADPGAACTNTGGSDTECSSPGNVQINDSPPPQNPSPGGFYGGPYPVPWDEGRR